jgi:arsenate reductase
VLVLCTGNSARSQIAEALLNHLGAGRVTARSAGSHPAAQVHPLAIAALAEIGIAWQQRTPRGIDGLEQEPWDAVITVCDNAREACPLFPAQPVTVHWGMSDPAAVEGSEDDRRTAFRTTRDVLQQRIRRLLVLPLETLSPADLRTHLDALAAT